jgi:copper resistance protein B
MSALKRYNRAGLPRAALAAAILLVLPLTILAQTAPASSSSAASMPMSSMPGMDHSGMDHGSMPGMTMPAAPAKAAKPANARSAGHTHGTKPAGQAQAGDKMSGTHSMAKPGMPPSTSSDAPAAASSAMADGAMSGMTPAPPSDVSGMTMPAMDHASMPGMGQPSASTPAATAGMSGMSMDSMQGGSAPANARSPDYSDGVSYGSMKPHMHGKRAIGMLLFDQLEAVDGRNGNGQSFQLSGWYGQDLNKLWLRSEGDVSHGKIEGGDVEAFWNHAIATYWGTMLGVRHDLGAGPNRNWLAYGVEGLASYWFKLEATGYVGESGRTAARLRANYEVLFTQRLILEPELEFNLYGKDDPARRIGSGLSDVSLGLRLRYEIRREFAPYIGINWVRRVGTTADYARADGQHVFDQQLVAGIRIWF